MSSGNCEAVGAGGVFVVGGVVAEAAVEDADEAVREGADGAVVGVAAGAYGAWTLRTAESDSKFGLLARTTRTR